MKRSLLYIMISVFCIVFTLSLVLNGCTGITKETTAASTTEIAATGEKPHLIFWTYSGAPNEHEWLQSVIDQINSNENFTVEMVIQSADTYMDILSNAGVSKKGFDFASDYSGSFSALLHGELGLFIPVNDLFEQSFFSNLSQGTLVANTDDQGNIYGVPYANLINLMVYNLELLKEAGIDTNNLPREWDDFINVCQKLKDAGMIPIGFANKEGIGNEFWGSDSMVGYFDNEKDEKEFWAAGKFVDNQDFRDHLDKYKFLYQSGYFDPSGDTYDYATHWYQDFAAGKVATNYVVNAQLGPIVDSLGEENVGYQIIPKFGNGGLSDSAIILGELLCVASFTKYPEESAKAIQYFVSEESQLRAVEFGLLPSITNIDWSESQDLPEHLKVLYIDNEAKFTEMTYAYFVGTQYDTYIKLATPYIKGELTFEEFAKGMEDATSTGE